MLARTHHRGGDVAAERGLLLLRLGLATLLLSLHGAPRLVRAFQYFVHGESWSFVDFLAGLGFPFPLMFALLSTSAESIAAFLVVIGFLTRSAACVVAINMTVAVYVEATGGDPFELPALYLLGALVVAISGGGAYSLDAHRRKNGDRHEAQQMGTSRGGAVAAVGSIGQPGFALEADR